MLNFTSILQILREYDDNEYIIGIWLDRWYWNESIRLDFIFN